jgi:hypothetical protein
MAGMAHPLVEEAMKKAAVAWVAVAGAPARALWCLPAGGALWVVSGTGEQAAPGLASASQALVTLRGDHGGRIVTWPAAVERVSPDSGQWAEVVPQLAAKRLNAGGDPAAQVARWAAGNPVSKLTPAGGPVETGSALPSGSLAEPPRETPARRRTRAPFRLHRVRRPRP